ncbi:MAG TPA: ABC transporter permease subunit [Vicinamibacterales bacterium]|nr:ABC transporter permease subunit [Vicinamibacterales bacterium]
MRRVWALVGKEFADQRQNLALFLPVLIVGIVAIAMPVVVAIVIPAVAGEKLSDSSDFEVALELYRDQPGLRGLNPEAAVQAFIFQYFSLMFMLIPITCAMSIAAYSIVGEKQARSLEPLLATPLTTMELLGAKVLSSLLPALLMTVACMGIYMLTILAFAQSGVIWAVLAPRTLAIVFVLGPLAGLAALQMAVCVSSRVNDARTAQQIGVTIILPVVGLFISQLMGAFRLTTPLMFVIAVVLVGLNAVLMAVAIRIFDRETILTRWK